MELIDLYDRHRQPTGFVTSREKKLAEGMYRLVVHICIFNEKGEMLIQQRQSTKKVFPDKWDISVGGQAAAGETSEQAAQREIKEELGIDIPLENVRPQATMNFDEGFDDIFIVTTDAEISDMKLQEEEVRAVDWADRRRIHFMIKSGAFVPYHPAYIDLLFSMSSMNGTFDQGKWSEG